MVKLSGKMDVDIFNRQLSTLYVDGSLTAGSDVMVDWASDKTITNGMVGIQFSDADVMAASEEYIRLGSIKGGSYRFEFTDAQAILRAD